MREEIYEFLNKSQKEAVFETEGPVMVIAGAGSGKTRVLTYRVVHLIDKGVNPSNILAVTFTNKAAKEMKERINQLLDGNINRTWISTFHSLCCRILRSHANYFEGYDRDFIIIDSDDQKGIIREILKESNIDPKVFPPKLFQDLISKQKNSSLDLVFNSVLDDYYPIVFSKYTSYCKQNNLFDFDDLLLFTVKLFKENEPILKYYQNEFKYIMIDEFQDTNIIQYELIYLLSHVHKNIFIVGDEDQSIYSFRGANIGNIRSFEKDFPKFKRFVLDINYRSSQQILDCANALIKNNINRYEKNLISDKGSNIDVYFKTLDSAYEEVSYIVSKIDYLIANRLSTLRDMVIIYRRNAQSRIYEDAFLRMNIPYRIFGGTSFFSRREIKDVIAYLRLIINPNDIWSFKRVINVPRRGIGDSTLDKYLQFCSENSYTYLQGISYYNNAKFLAFGNIINSIKQKINETSILPNYIDIILEETKYKDYLMEDGLEGKERIFNVEELKSILVEADEIYEGNNEEKLRSLLNEITLRTDKEEEEKNKDDNYISLMTYHQAKGLEYDTVFLVGMEQGVFPSYQSLSDNLEMEEERRVAYVGVTRAKKYLYVTNAKVRMLYGQTNSYPLSIFVTEMLKAVNKKEPSELLDKNQFYSNTITSENNSNKEITNSSFKINFSNSNGVVSNFVDDSNFVPFTKGEKIEHQIFGKGIVINIEADYIYVAFDHEVGVKKLKAKHAMIRRI